MFEEKMILISRDPENIGKLCELIGEMPNIDFPTMWGHVFWENLSEYNGWRLQKNVFTGHCRILDPSDIRRAWGSESAMFRALRKLQPKTNNNVNDNMIYCPSCCTRVPNGKFCKECGSRIN